MTTHSFRQTAASLLLIFLCVSAEAQETRYVTDILQLGLFANQDGSGQAMRNLVSGTEVTVLERIPNFARVRTSNGEEGWVKSAFLVVDKPAQLIVAETQARIGELEAELAERTAELEEAASGFTDRLAEADRSLAAAQAMQAELERLRSETQAHAGQMDLYRGSVPWPWVVGASLLALALGLSGGYWWLDMKIRRRHGGFRVY